MVHYLSISQPDIKHDLAWVYRWSWGVNHNIPWWQSMSATFAMCHTWVTFHHWWALDQIWLRCCAEKTTRNRLSLVVTCWAPTVCEVPTCPILCGWSLAVSSNTWKRSASSTQVYLLSYLIVAFSVPIIQDLWTDTVEFIKKWQISRPKILEPMPGGAFTYSSIIKDMTYLVTWSGHEQAHL